MNARLAPLALLGLVLMSACSDSGSGTGNTPGSDGAGATTASSTPAGSEFVPVDVPAGVNWAPSSLTPPAVEAVALPSFEQVTATAGVPAAPAGYPFRQSDYISQLFVLGDVQLATGTCGCWQGGDSSGVFGGLRTPIYLFRSTDGGATWAQVNLAGVLGDVNGQISDIVEHDGAMVLTATTTDAAAVAPTVVNVLRSTDGATWERIGTVASDAGTPVPVHAFDLYSLDSALVLYGGDMACDFDGSSAIQNIGPAYQTRFWTSTDGGANWAAQSPTDTGLAIDRPALPDATTCAGLGIQDVIDTYASSPRLVTGADDRVIVWSQDGQQIVSSSDGTTWASATLDGATPAPVEGMEALEASSEAAEIFAIDGQFVALNLENYRQFDDTATGSSAAFSVLAWTSTDGASWQRQPLGRPILNPDYNARYQFFVTDGGLGLRAYDPVENVEYGMYESVAGVSQNWTKCAAAPDADCSFATELSDFAPGADLSGIDLSYASIEGRDLTDVSFAGARLWATNMIGVTIDRTNFDGAELSIVQLIGDLSTSSFDGATLSGVSFDDHFFTTELAGASIESPTINIADTGLPTGVSLAGRDLTGYSFTGGSLAGADFSGANLSRVSISYTDLTGADFTGAILDGVFFFDVTCPDGQPMSEEGFGAERCRL